MGLDVATGILAELITLDEKRAEAIRSDVARINAQLHRMGLPPHVEPETCESWSWELGAYGDLHQLRRLAAHLDRFGRLPGPELDSDSSASEDPVLRDYYSRLERKPFFLARVLGLDQRRPGGFDHLINHSDCDGYYLPLDFPNVIQVPAYKESPASIVGSAPALLRELERLATALELPPDASPECSPTLDPSVDSESSSSPWSRHPIAADCCVVLRHACRQAVRSGSLLAYC